MSDFNLEDFKKLCKENRELALAVCKARAYAEVMREQVDKYTLPIFNKYKFRVSFSEMRGEYGEFVKSPKDLYLTDLDSQDVKNFYKDVAAEHRKHGFKGPEDHCPALVAENFLTEAENVLLDVFKEFFKIEECGLYGENRKKMLNLVMGACLIKEDKAA